MFLPLIMVLLWQAGSDNAVSTTSYCTQDLADEAVYRALSLFIGDGRRYSVEDIEVGIPGLKSRTVSSWIASSPDNRRAPKARDIMRIAHFLGQDGIVFLSKIYGQIGLGVHSLTPKAGDPGMVIATVVAAAAKFAELGADGVYCHRDQGALEPVTDQLIATVLPFSTRAPK